MPTHTKQRGAVKDRELREEWAREADLVSRRIELVTDVVDACGLDPSAKNSGRAAVQFIDATLVHAMEMALESAPPETAARIATECVALAEAKDRLNWEVLGKVSGELEGEAASALRTALTEVNLRDGVRGNDSR